MKANHCTVVMAAVLFLLLSGCNGSPSIVSTTPTPTSIPGLTLQPCTVDDFIARCGALSVLEDRAAQSGRKIDLKIAVIPAHSASRAPGPIFWFAGGPGGAATEDIPFTMQVLGPANEARDLVFVNQRGTGGSNKRTCAAPPERDKQLEVLRDCVAKVNAGVSAYTTAWGMDDVGGCSNDQTGSSRWSAQSRA